MGKPRFLPGGLTALLLVAACGDGGGSLLVAADVESTIYAGGEQSKFRIASTNEALRGAIRGTIRFSGRKWRLRKLDLATDFCVNANPGGIMSESFLVNPDGTLPGVVVYIKQGLRGMKFDPPSEAVVLNQKNCRYFPHIVLLQVDQPLVIKSSDNTNHNVHGLDGPNPEFNQSMTRPSELQPKKFSRTEVCKRIICDVHGWMGAWVAILPHPYAAITGKDGSFELKDVPPGTYQLAAWHEKMDKEAYAVVTVDNNGTATQDFTFERKE